MNLPLPNFPKIESPFVRMHNSEWHYVVTPEINPNCEWVFTDPDVRCVEKMDGTNLSIEIRNKQVIAIQNRLNIINPRSPSTAHLMEWLYESLKKWYLDLPDWIYFGELIWPKLNGNPMELEKHIRLPFISYCAESLVYKSFTQYPRTFESLSNRFRNDIFSLYYRKVSKWWHKKPEWVMFYHPDGRLAKLRCDMFDWREGPRHNE